MYQHVLAAKVIFLILLCHCDDMYSSGRKPLMDEW